MTTRTGPVFRNSTNGTGSNCVDVGAWHDTVVLRDSKDCTGDFGDYPTLTVPTTAWTAFTTELKSGRLDG
ncbi:DUF397 domain-containing protein [Phytomonospora endophytica]|uniref:DUF397 domain-containing protein n=1 Tax=Phytomonospora endophytica TaxID=714109 RepID=A0A841FQ75_9ACTN|nr:DUF397 domain-containing protein [Phytomonospora endophytica]MBB6035948.1 hypothetical protein [Phytomonospora endophytica]GIG66853.1 hypothetical protein Pen01_31480 [Phytomonospora endophytica]